MTLCAAPRLRMSRAGTPTRAGGLLGVGVGRRHAAWARGTRQSTGRRVPLCSDTVGGIVAASNDAGTWEV